MTAPSFDTMLDRLHERRKEGLNDESDLDTLCDNCHGTLTKVDRDLSHCSQCTNRMRTYSQGIITKPNEQDERG